VVVGVDEGAVDVEDRGRGRHSGGVPVLSNETLG
jgi:hypothetical protein